MVGAPGGCRPAVCCPLWQLVPHVDLHNLEQLLRSGSPGSVRLEDDRKEGLPRGSARVRVFCILGPFPALGSSELRGPFLDAAPALCTAPGRTSTETLTLLLARDSSAIPGLQR